MNKLWTLARFAYMNAGDDESLRIGFQTPPNPVNPADHWILSRLAEIIPKVCQLIEAYDFSGAANLLYHFTWDELCDWYVEFSKIPLRLQREDSRMQSARHTLLFSLSCILRLLNPFIPFITEHLYALGLGASNGLHTLRLDPLKDLNFDAKKAQDFSRVIGLITMVRSLKGDHGLEPLAPVEIFVLNRHSCVLPLVSELKPAIESLIKGKIAGVNANQAPEGFWWRTSDGTLDAFVRPLRQATDMGSERARLLKEIEKIDQEIQVLKERLDNPNFRQRAPKEVVLEHMERMGLLNKKKESALEHLSLFKGDGK
jgi:valyl-tRNA synthetase